MFYTLDYNCIIALEKKIIAHDMSEEPKSSMLEELVALCKMGQIPVYVYSRLFLENPRRNGERLDLTKTLEAVGQGHIQTRGSETTDQAFLRWVHYTLFSNIEFEWSDYLAVQSDYLNIPYVDMREIDRDRRPASSLNKPIVTVLERLDAATKQHYRELWEKLQRKWNNAKSDALALSAHISWGDGIFVASDANFQRKAQKLRERIPSLKIMEPEEALEEAHRLVGEDKASSA